MDFKQEIWNGKSFEDLLKDIYDKSEENEKTINNLIQTLENYVEDVHSAVMMVPLIKDYLDAGIKNNEHLIKIAAIIQKALSSNGNKNENEDIESFLSEEDIEEIKEEIENIKNEETNNK